MSSQEIETEYANTDFDLRSSVPFDNLHEELLNSCRVLHYTTGADGKWHAIIEARHGADSRARDAEKDIRCIADVLKTLSARAREELSACELREFNIGFHCGDTWAYTHQVPQSIVRMVADVSCSIAVTLYPKRNAVGPPKI